MTTSYADLIDPALSPQVKQWLKEEELMNADMAEKYPMLSDAVSPEDINAGMAKRVGQLGFNAQSIPKTAMDAAVKLRDTIRARPNQRHVRVETTVDGNVNFVHTLVVSVDPSSGVAVLLSEIDGFPVRIEPWPTH